MTFKRKFGIIAGQIRRSAFSAINGGHALKRQACGVQLARRGLQAIIAAIKVDQKDGERVCHRHLMLGRKPGPIATGRIRQPAFRGLPVYFQKSVFRDFFFGQLFAGFLIDHLHRQTHLAA
ncbi:hypothetical protein, partial [Actibacterium sp.]|uniref:hypothetical protein n=1 Tax=Actibacterium sp. TaxID=1872125 RepID=UPI00356989C5